MKINRRGKQLVMTESLICKNFYEKGHIGYYFSEVGRNMYRCSACNAVMVVKGTDITLSDHGHLKVCVTAEYLYRNIDYVNEDTAKKPLCGCGVSTYRTININGTKISLCDDCTEYLHTLTNQDTSATERRSE